MRPVVAIVGALLAYGVPSATASSPPASIVGVAAPSWEGVRWVAHAPAGGLQPTSFRGRVLVLSFFQADREDGMAALAAGVRHYAASSDVAFVAVQWLGWEQAPIATPAQGRALLARHGLAIPHGVLVGSAASRESSPFWRYAVAAMPWTVVVDRGGSVRFAGAPRDLSRLLVEIEPLRVVREAANPLVGQAFGGMDSLRWATPDGRPVSLASHRLTLFRWWTNACAHCTTSVPALARLEQRYAARGLRMVAVYHPKGRRLDDAQAVAYARGLGFRGAVGFDDRWTKFLELQRRGDLRRATSVSVLVDSSGIVRWVHLGPRIHESRDLRHPEAAPDLAALDSLVDRLLPPAAGPPAAPRR